MYSANIYLTMGLGLDIVKIASDSYKGLKEKVSTFLGNNKDKKIKILGYDTEITIEKVVYNYPSGKKFIEKF